MIVLDLALSTLVGFLELRIFHRVIRMTSEFSIAAILLGMTLKL